MENFNVILGISIYYIDMIPKIVTSNLYCDENSILEILKNTSLSKEQLDKSEILKYRKEFDDFAKDLAFAKLDNPNTVMTFLGIANTNSLSIIEKEIIDSILNSKFEKNIEYLLTTSSKKGILSSREINEILSYAIQLSKNPFLDIKHFELKCRNSNEIEEINPNSKLYTFNQN